MLGVFHMKNTNFAEVGAVGARYNVKIVYVFE